MTVHMLLSGGVDSSVALALLRRRGDLRIKAYYLKIWLEDELAYLGDCPWEEDLRYARATCNALDVELEIVPLQREYFDRVVSYALDELRAGRTPSPDIFCNRRIKFGAFFDYLGTGTDHIASGHYARIVNDDGRFRLLRAPDPVKDQSYFLSHLTQEQVARAMFPIGELRKREVRGLAEELRLPTSARPDSQGICFLGKIRYPEFVRHYLGERAGEIVEWETGRRLGGHRGYWFHTIGQRQGLGLGNGPWYVVGKDLEENVVFVSHAARGDARGRSRFTVADPSWIAEPPESGRFTVKLRHGPELIGAEVTWLADGRLQITLDRADNGIAAGQFAVLYRGDECIGGARIEVTAASYAAQPTAY